MCRIFLGKLRNKTQLRMVTSTVHLTGSPKEDIKEAMSKLLSRSTNKFCSKKGKWIGDAEVGVKEENKGWEGSGGEQIEEEKK